MEQVGQTSLPRARYRRATLEEVKERPVSGARRQEWSEWMGYQCAMRRKRVWMERAGEPYVGEAKGRQNIMNITQGMHVVDDE